MTLTILDSAEQNEHDFPSDRELLELLWHTEDHHFWIAARNAWIAQALAARGLEPGARVLEAGCGSGAVAGMQRLAALGLADLLAERVEQGRPLLAVCLGLQLLCEASEESPGVAGSGCCPPRCGASRVGSTVLACWCPSSDGTGWIPRTAAR